MEAWHAMMEADQTVNPMTPLTPFAVRIADLMMTIVLY